MTAKRRFNAFQDKDIQKRIVNTLTWCSSFVAEHDKGYNKPVMDQFLELDDILYALGSPNEKVKKPKRECWTCFHCDETFTDKKLAAEHFGINEFNQPACILKVTAGERGLLTQLRAAENIISSYQSEDQTIMRQLAQQQSRHADALRVAEEAGYSRGLEDAQRHGIDLSDDAKTVFKKVLDKFNASLRASHDEDVAIFIGDDLLIENNSEINANDFPSESE